MRNKLHLSAIKSKNKKDLKEKSVKSIFFIAAIFGVIIIFSILIFLVRESFPPPTDIWTFLTGTEWKPTGEPERFQTLPLTVGTLLVTFGAMALAIPLSIGSAIFVSEIATSKIRALIKPAIELLAGIPSVVYGFFGLIILTDFIKDTFNVPTGETWFAGSIILGIMAIPTITTVAEDAINAVPREFKEGSLALGATKWQTISKVILPSAISGISAAIILGIGRAVGETMAIMMVCGNSAVIPDPIWDVFTPIRTLTSNLGIEMGEVAFGSSHYHALFGVAVLLLSITLIINLSAVYILSKLKEKHYASSKKKKSKKVKRDVKLILSAKKYFKHFLIGLLILFVYVISGLFFTIGIILAGIILLFLSKKLSQNKIQKIAFAAIVSTIIVVLIIISIILLYIITNGIEVLSWEFISQPHRSLGREGGVYTAIVGTFYLVAGAIAIALPIGVGAAIYLVEYTREGKITKIIRAGADLLNGTPSIVFGLFGFAFLVLALGFGRSLIAGQITLAFMIIPTIIRTSEEALKSVPQTIREGSYALGATRWQTIKKVVLPPATPGVITGAILGIGRAAGETAPILFTAAAFSSFIPNSIFEPVNSLPYHLFVMATEIPGIDAKAAAGGTAFILLLLVSGFYLVAIFIRNRYQKIMKW